MAKRPNSQQEELVEQTTTNSTPEKHGVSRRNFLKASAVGAGALAAMPTIGTVEHVVAAPAAQGGGNGQGKLLAKDESDPLAQADLTKVAETWAEPSTWRPSDWPGQSLPLHVVENAAPMAVIGKNFNNAKPLLFSYNGTTPGPTIRMKGDETLFIHLRNMLGPDLGQTPVGVYTDPKAGLPGPEGALYNANPDQFGPDVGQIPLELREDWCLGEHTNGVHSNHVTNLHTHGLHVRPATNPDGTHTDNVILRVMPQADWLRREASLDPDCRFLRENEVVGQAPYEFRLGNVQDNPEQVHPAGTFWYHPHAHGATHNQVAAGMAGFLIVEGDIEEKLHEQLVVSDIDDDKLKNPVYQLPYDPSRRTGPFDYRERLMFVQRVQNTATDPDAPTENIGSRQNKIIFDTTNGSFEPRIIRMRPGAIERWRILNGSVDGKSYMRFMVLKGRYEYKKNPPPKALFRIEADGTETQIKSMAELRDVKHRLWLLAWDGIALVSEKPSGECEYYIQNLDFDAAPDPLVLAPNLNLDDIYKDAASVKAAYVQPNELDMSAANRADILIQAPILDGDTSAQIYTVVGMGTPLHADAVPRPDTIVAYLVVGGDKVEGMSEAKPGDYKNLDELILPPVQDYLKPVANDELAVLDPKQVPDNLPPQQQYVLQNEISQYNETVGDKTETVVDVDTKTGEKTVVTTIQKPTKVVAGNLRTRRITYSGWGAAHFPRVSVPDEYVEKYPDQQKLRYYKAPESITIPGVDLPDGTKISELTITDLSQPDGQPLPTLLLTPGTRTMAIDGRKFNPTDLVHPQMLWWTAEEWMLTNNSTTLWQKNGEPPIFFTGQNVPTKDDISKILKELKGAIAQEPQREDLQYVQAIYIQLQKLYPKEGDNPIYSGSPKAYPMLRSQAKNDYTPVTSAADHPFHMHQNPFWVMRIEVPDENGNLVNILDQPRWQDTIWIPRNGGRVIFRSRFPDYLGMYVNHCHLLLHEDNGMMQAVETVPTANSANYVPTEGVLYPGITDEEVDKLYPTASKDLGQAWQDSIRFIDPDPNTGQYFPGFDLEVPTPPA